MFGKFDLEKLNQEFAKLPACFKRYTVDTHSKEATNKPVIHPS